MIQMPKHYFTCDPARFKLAQFKGAELGSTMP